MRCVGFAEKKQGLAASRRLDAENVYPHPVLLGLLDADANIFVS